MVKTARLRLENIESRERERLLGLLEEDPDILEFEEEDTKYITYQNNHYTKVKKEKKYERRI